MALIIDSVEESFSNKIKFCVCVGASVGVCVCVCVCVSQCVYIWEYDPLDLGAFLWIYVDIYVDFGYLTQFLTGHIHIWIYVDTHM